MSITIDRAGTDGITIPDPEISWSGDQVTLTGVYTPTVGSATGLADTLWLREQLLGLVGNDEPVVPVTWSGRGEFDGYYRPTDVSASLPQGSTQTDAPFLNWSVTLERLQDYRQPRMEVMGIYGPVSNGLGVSGDLVIAAPEIAIDWWPGVWGTNLATRPTPDGDVQVAYSDATVISDSYVSQLSLAPAFYYIGACGAEYDVDGTPTWRKVVGRRAFTTADVAVGNAVRISNGLVRVRANATQLLVEWYDGASWSTPTTFQLWETVTFVQAIRYVGARILRSSPTEVVLRLAGIMNGSTLPFTVDLRLRRGQRLVYGRIGALINSKFSLRFGSPTASTSLTGGLRRTSNNSSGDREILISDTATTKDTSNGTITDPTARLSFLFGIGVELGGSSATLQEVAARQVAEWFMSTSETQRVVAG